MPTIDPFSGQEQINAEPAKVFALLTDPDALKDCIPDVVSVERTGPTSLKGVVKPGFSFIRGTLRFTLECTATDPGTGVAVKIRSEGIGTRLGVESTMKVSPEGAGSIVNWEARVVELGGLVAAAPAGLIKAAADKTVRDGWDRIRTKLSGQ
jgi:carbon monoxide dehydrogenase subunit G